MYCLLTTFHVDMYFSIQAVKHPSSLFDNDVPGIGMHFSKQCSFTFYGYKSVSAMEVREMSSN